MNIQHFILPSVVKTIYICTSGRSGSSYFVDLMLQTGVLGKPKEYFGKDTQVTRMQELEVKDFSSYLNCLDKQMVTQNKVFATKLFPEDLENLQYQLAKEISPNYQQLSYYEILQSFSQETYFIWLTRRNKIKQALSLYRAFKTNQWRYTKNSTSNQLAKPPKISEIVWYMQYIVKLDALWADFFQKHHIQPLVYVYEDFVLDPKIYLKELINYVGIAMPEQFVVESEHRVVSDKNNEDWYQQYLAHLETEESQRRKQRDFFLQFRRLSQRIFYKFKSLQKR